MKKFLLLVLALLFAFGAASLSTSRVSAHASADGGPIANQPSTQQDLAAPQTTQEIRCTSALTASAVPADPSLTQGLPQAATLPAAGPSGALTAAQVTSSSQPSPEGSYRPYQLETLVIASQSLGGAERIAQVYLPGDYAATPDQRFPVLYSFDGQQLSQLSFEQNLDSLVSSGQIAPVIVVAVFSTEGDLRREELGTGPALNMLGWGTQSEAFNQFVVNELVPRVDSSYRTLTGAAHTGVMGWSLGGLTAFYLAWQNPDVFGTVGAFSPSFWWRTPSAAGEELQARVIPALVQSSVKRPGLRMWFEAGTAELPYSDVDNNGVIDMIQDVQDVMGLLSAKGYQTGTDMLYTQVEGGLHELSTWETVMPGFLKFAYGIK